MRLLLSGCFRGKEGEGRVLPRQEATGTAMLPRVRVEAKDRLGSSIGVCVFGPPGQHARNSNAIEAISAYGLHDRVAQADGRTPEPGGNKRPSGMFLSTEERRKERSERAMR